jgi:hypothetical protein
MNSHDILKLYISSYPTFELDLKSIKRFEAESEYEKAGERCRYVARNLLKQRLFNHSVDYLHQASEFFINCSKHLKAISSELTVYEIYRLTNNLVGMADTYEKIASFYTYYLKNEETAGWYYFMSAKKHEQNRNYFSAFKKARFACDCLEKAKNKEKLRSAHALAFRMALQSNYIERAGIHAKKWLDLMPKDYSPHYISICMKGYKSFIATHKTSEALLFVNEIIIANYEKGIAQHNIVQYLKDALQLYINEHKTINEDYHAKIINEYGKSLTSVIKYCIEMKAYCNQIGLTDLSDFFYLHEMNYRKTQSSQQNKYLQTFGYWLWRASSDYGLNLKRWLAVSLGVMLFFALLFYPYHFDIDQNSSFYKVASTIKPSISSSELSTWFSPFYYSVITFATLGYGDILPIDVSGQIFCVLEVLIGYLMLGGLLTIFAKKIIR